jgi:hypothetical protein
MSRSDPASHYLGLLVGQAEHDPNDNIVRNAVQLRAKDACEYCLMPTYGRYEVDHIIPRARWTAYVDGSLPTALHPARVGRALNHVDNYAWACAFCNSKKHDHVDGPVDPARSGHGRARLFDPRHDKWPEHFYYRDDLVLIYGRSAIGMATVQALGLNEAPSGLSGPLHTPLSTRIAAMRHGLYPPWWARRHRI